jgi:hypothetical protein
MKIRSIGALLGGAAFALVTATGGFAEDSRLTIQQALVGKAAKKTPGDTKPAGRVIVEDSYGRQGSTASGDRMGGGGGAKGAVQLNPQPEPGRTK